MKPPRRRRQHADNFLWFFIFFLCFERSIDDLRFCLCSFAWEERFAHSHSVRRYMFNKSIDWGDRVRSKVITNFSSSVRVAHTYTSPSQFWIGFNCKSCFIRNCSFSLCDETTWNQFCVLVHSFLLLFCDHRQDAKWGDDAANENRYRTSIEWLKWNDEEKRFGASVTAAIFAHQKLVIFCRFSTIIFRLNFSLQFLCCRRRFDCKSIFVDFSTSCDLLEVFLVFCKILTLARAHKFFFFNERSKQMIFVTPKGNGNLYDSRRVFFSLLFFVCLFLFLYFDCHLTSFCWVFLFHFFIFVRFSLGKKVEKPLHLVVVCCVSLKSAEANSNLSAIDGIQMRASEKKCLKSRKSIRVCHDVCVYA